MVLLHWETLCCPNRHGQSDGQPCNTGQVVQPSRSHDTPQAHDQGWGCREALRYGTAPDGLDADRAIFEIAVCTLEQGKALQATARRVSVDAETALGVFGFCPSGAATSACARIVAAPKSHTRYWFAARVALCDPGDGDRHP
jgi:hypothetical protein